MVQLIKVSGVFKVSFLKRIDKASIKNKKWKKPDNKSTFGKQFANTRNNLKLRCKLLSAIIP